MVKSKFKLTRKVIAIIIVGLFLLNSIGILVIGLSLITPFYTLLFYLFLIICFVFLLRKTNKNFLLFIVSTLLCLLFLDFGIRFIVKKNLTYSEINGSLAYASFYEHSHFFSKIKRKRKLGEFANLLVAKPNSVKIDKKKEFQYEHHYNELGLRNDTLSKKKRENEYRIIALGDSFTEGLGAPQDSSFVAQLETLLNEESNKTVYNCINAGIAGSDPIFSYELFSRELLEYKPDMVLLVLNSSDPRDIFTRGGAERYTENGALKLKKGPWWEYFYGTSFIVRLIVKDFLHFNDYLAKENNFGEQLNSSFDSIYDTILKFQELSQKEGFEFKVVFMPFINELYNDRISLEPIHQYLKDVNRDIGIVYLPPCYIDYMVTFSMDPAKFYWPLDTHHNSLGYKLMAECIRQQLF